MKRFFTRHKSVLISISTVVVFFGVLLLPNGLVHGQNNLLGDLAGGGIKEVILRIIAIIVYWGLSMISWFVWLSGIFLDKSIYIAFFSMKSLAETPAVEMVWKTIRDVSSIFFIFALLYTSIRLILGKDSTSKMKEVIVGVVVAGVLMNFSLYFTKVIIDTSNIASLAIYRAITPDTDGNISEVFMQALKIQTIFDGTNAASKDPGKTTINIIIASIFGFILMVVVSLCFLAIALLFFVRTVFLLLVLAFSPIYFIAKILPQAQPYAKKWEGYLIGYSFFPVIYLFITYIGMRLMTDPSFTNLIAGGNAGSPTTGAPSTFGAIASYASGSIGVVIQFGVTVFIMSGALVAALSFLKDNGIAYAFADSLSKVASGFQNNTLSWLGKNTGGRAMNKLANTNTMQTVASRVPGGGLLLKGVRYAGSGYKESVEKKAKEKVEFAQSLGYNKNRVNKIQAQLDSDRALLSEHETDRDRILLAKKKLEKQIAEKTEALKKETYGTQSYALIESEIKTLNGDLSKATEDLVIAETTVKIGTGVVKSKQEQIDSEKKRRTENYLQANPKSVWSKISASVTGTVSNSEKTARENYENSLAKKKLDKLKEGIKDKKQKLSAMEKVGSSATGFTSTEADEYDKLLEEVANDNLEIKKMEAKIKEIKEDKEKDKKS